jgi:hypothetical protein
VVDAGSDDAQEASTAIATFVAEVSSAWCERVAACCGTILDALTFNPSSCQGAYAAGPEGVLAGVAHVADAGRVQLNASEADYCLRGIAAIDCTANLISAAEHAALIDGCAAAVGGVQQLNQACTVDVECAGNQFCSGDGGGTCEQLSMDGGLCNARQDECSARGLGNTGLTCSATTCTPAAPLGAACSRNSDCSSRLCGGSPQQCSNATSFVTPTLCSQFL